MDIPCHHWDCHWGFLTERWPVARRKHCSPPRWRVAVVAKSVAVAAAVGDGGSSSRDQTSGANVGNFCGSPWTRRLPSRKDWPSDLSSGRPTKPPFFPVSTHNQQVRGKSLANCTHNRFYCPARVAISGRQQIIPLVGHTITQDRNTCCHSTG